MNKRISFLISLSTVAILPSLASAQDITVQTIMQGAVTTTFYIADGVVVILWVVTGLLFLLARGAPESLKTAKASLIAAVAGTILVIVADSAVYLVSNAFNLQLT